MRLTRARIQGLKGCYEEFEVAPLNLIVGPNGTNKTARLLAIPWALHGCTPVGKDTAAMQALAGPQGMDVELVTDAGFTFSRGITVSGGSARQSIRVNGAARTIKDGAAEIAAHCGSFSAHLNLAEFTSLSPEGKRNFILRLCESSRQTSKESLLARLEVAVLDGLLDGAANSACRLMHSVPVDQASPDQLAALAAKLWEQTDPDHRAAWDRMRARLDHVGSFGDATTQVSNWLELAKGLKSEHKKGRDNAEQATRRIMADKNTIDCPSDLPAALNQRLEKLRGIHAELCTQLGAIEGRERAVQQTMQLIASEEQARIRAEEKLKSVSTALASRDWDGELADLDARIAELENAGSMATGALGEVADRHRAAERARDAAIMARESTRAAFDQARRELETSRSELQRAKADPWLQVKAVAGKLRAHGAPETIAMAEELEAIVDANMASVRSRIEQLEFDIASLEADLSEHESNMAACESSIQEAQLRLDEASAELEIARNAARQANVERIKLAGLREQREKVVMVRDRMQREVEQLRSEIEAIGVRIAKAHERITELNQSSSQPDGDLAGLRARKDECEAEIRRVTDKLVARERFDALESELAECQAAKALEESSLELAGHLQKAIQVLRDEITVEQVGPLLSRIDAFLAHTGIDVRSYCDLQTETGRAAFDLGWERDGLRVSMDTLSGGESALFGAALAYALVSLSDQPLRVLCIEADTLDTRNMGALLDALEAVSGDLSNVFVATCHDPGEMLSAAWNTVHTGPAASVS